MELTCYQSASHLVGTTRHPNNEPPAAVAQAQALPTTPTNLPPVRFSGIAINLQLHAILNPVLHCSLELQSRVNT